MYNRKFMIKKSAVKYLFIKVKDLNKNEFL